MEQILMNLIVGAIGGNGVAKVAPDVNLGVIGNTIAGAIGGTAAGQIVLAFIPAVTAAAQAGNLSVSGVVTHLIASGAGGALMTAAVAMFKKKAA